MFDHITGSRIRLNSTSPMLGHFSLWMHESEGINPVFGTF